MSELELLRCQVDRLRARTHEIQAQEMSKRANLDRRLARWRSMWEYAERYCNDTTWWSHTSYRDRAVLMRAVGERNRALAVVGILTRGAVVRRLNAERARRLAEIRVRLEEYFTAWEACEGNPWDDPDGGELRVAGALRDVLDELSPEGLRIVAERFQVD